MAETLGANIEGLDDFRKQLRRMESKELTDGLKQVNFDVAEHVAGRAQRTAQGLSVRNLAGNAVSSGAFKRAAATLAPRRQQKAAKLGVGAARAPDALGWEFGSKGHRQFPKWRGNQWPSTWAPEGVGYFLHPTIRREEATIIDMYGDGIEQLSKRAFPRRR